MDHRAQAGSNRLDHWSEETLWHTNNNKGEDKILEIDTWKPRLPARTYRSDSKSPRTALKPTRSEYSSWGYYPNHMVKTESCRAKVRSVSAPRQRLEFSDNNGHNRSVHGHYCYYYTAADRSVEQCCGGGLSEGLNRRNPSGRSKIGL
ncbi:PREDICTED: uncharacterized protein LOC104818275 [Tarenaya hassleriana]|uniref:uncharacterized protein LOC104818275 n=1 Tax=Tarenaya hassleriana TaxID=28532 RepID=UPI00053C29FF|nr:PREDICTED: uncharacterized protein LOC104818275 [Tarenaya hassleriana]